MLNCCIYKIRISERILNCCIYKIRISERILNCCIHNNHNIEGKK